MDNTPALKTTKTHGIKINNLKSKLQKRIVIKGIEIFFPYEPYRNQLTYMGKVIDSLESKSYAALESPTGTGKTLCLLCASLAWLKSIQDKGKTLPNQKIFYTSRTHSQLKQVFKELKTTCYEPITSILSSRDNLCVNSALKDLSGEKKNLFCQLAKKRNGCPYAAGVDNYSEKDFVLCDIEELYQLGCSKNFCPFYYQKKHIKECDIVFMPYNYIFEPDIRIAFDLSLENVIILIDEAHNMNSVCEDGVSCELTESIMHDCVKDLEQLYIELKNPQKKSSSKSPLHQINENKLNDDIEIIKSLTLYLRNFNLSKKTWPVSGITLSPKEMFDFFFEGSKMISNKAMMSFVGKTSEDYAYLSPKNIRNHLKNLDLVIKGIKEEYEKTTRLADYVKMLELVQLFYQDHEANKVSNAKELYVNSFTFYISSIEDKSNSTKKQNGLFFYCFNPGFGFKLIQKAAPYSILITSGTLSPISGMESELKCPFPIQLENSHVADQSQINFSIITRTSNSSALFKFDKTNRDDVKMIIELGMTILKLCKVAPGGILVFFPSYFYMNDVYSKWVNNDDILGKLSQYKTIYKDKQNTRESQEVIKLFKESNIKNSRKGGLMLSVCRGSSSEGVDFSDDYARMVIVVGIPFANLGCDKVQLKKLFLDKYQYGTEIKKKLNGSQWYTNDAILAVNQSLGRVIRHKDDYGSMIVIDSRYTEIFKKKLFSGWLTQCGKVYSNNDYLNDLKAFYEAMKAFSLSVQMSKETNDNDRMKLKWTTWQNSTNTMAINKEDYNDDFNSQILRQTDLTGKKNGFLHSKNGIDNNKRSNSENDDNDGDDDDNNKETDKTKKKYILFNSLKTPSNEKGKLFLNHKKKIDQSITSYPLYTPSIPSSSSSVKRTENYPVFPNYSEDKSNKVNQIKLKLKSFADKPKKGIEFFFGPKEDEVINIKDDSEEEVEEKDKKVNNNNIEDKTIKKFLDFTPIQPLNRKENKEDTEANSEKIMKKLLDIKNESESGFMNLILKFNEKLESNNYNSNASTSNIPPKNNKEQQIKENKATIKKRYECPVCFESNIENPLMNFSSSKCGHILCDDCWDKSLQNRLECPLCKHKVRLNTLTKLFLI